MTNTLGKDDKVVWCQVLNNALYIAHVASQASRLGSQQNTDAVVSEKRERFLEVAGGVGGMKRLNEMSMGEGYSLSQVLVSTV
jgi:hypothetical protein